MTCIDNCTTPLAADYAPQFSAHSHGFRPKKGCHTALMKIQRPWMGTKGCIAMDIHGCFDTIAPTPMMNILRQKIHDHRLLRLIEGMLKAGYGEDWHYHPSLRGTPPGGVVSPILAPIDLDQLDQSVEQPLMPQDTRGHSRRDNLPYQRLRQMARRRRRRGKPAEASA
jgi:retron-type reverse transcriptase